MKRYQVHEYLTKGLFAYRPINRMIKSKFAKPNRRGGIIVFPDGVKEKDIDTSSITGRFRMDFLLSDKYTTADGTLFTEYSPCLDIRDYRSCDIITAALRFARSYPGKTLILKDIDDKRLYTICYTPKEVADKNTIIHLDGMSEERQESKAA